MAGGEMTRLLRRPGYARYFAVVAATRTTGPMFSVAGVVLVLERTHSLTLAGLLVAAATLPGALTGPFLGAWLDVTSSRRRLLVLDRGVSIAAVLALLAATGHAPDWAIPAIGIAYGVTAPLSSGAFASVLPEIAGAELLDVANTFEATTINAAFIVGPALAGALSGAAGAAAALALQAGLDALLSVMIALDVNFELRPDTAPGAGLRGMRSAVEEGMRTLWRSPALRWNAITSVVYVSAWGTLNVSFPAFAESVGAGAHAGGYLWAAISFGSMVSAFALRAPALRLVPRTLIAGSFAAMALSVLAWPLAGGLGAAIALVALTGALEGPSLVALIGTRQRLAPGHVRGQIMSTVISIDLAAAAVAAALAGPFHAALGTHATLYAFAALTAAAAVIALARGSGWQAGTTMVGKAPG